MESTPVVRLRRSHRRRVSIGVLSLAVAAMVGVVPTPAHAIDGVEIVTKSSRLSDSSTPKDAKAACSGTKRVIDAGFDNWETNGDLLINDLIPSSTSAFVRTNEIVDGKAENWRVDAYAICANAPADIEVRRGGTGINSMSPKWATARCTGTKKLIGTGADVKTTYGGRVVLDAIKPHDALTSVTVRAVEYNGASNESWGVEAIAICATAPVGLQLFAAQSVPSALERPGIGVVAHCPPGKVLLGTGGEILSGDGHVVLSSVQPVVDDPPLPTANVVRAHRTPTGTPATWDLKGYAICASSIDG